MMKVLPPPTRTHEPAGTAQQKRERAACSTRGWRWVACGGPRIQRCECTRGARMQEGVQGPCICVCICGNARKRAGAASGGTLREMLRCANANCVPALAAAALPPSPAWSQLSPPSPRLCVACSVSLCRCVECSWPSTSGRRSSAVAADFSTLQRRTALPASSSLLKAYKTRNGSHRNGVFFPC